MNFKTALILTFSPREKEPPLLSLPSGETDTPVPVRVQEWATGEGWGEGNLFVSPIDYYF